MESVSRELGDLKDVVGSFGRPCLGMVVLTLGLGNLAQAAFQAPAELPPYAGGWHWRGSGSGWLPGECLGRAPGSPSGRFLTGV